MNVTLDDISPLFQYRSASNNNTWILQHGAGAYPDGYTPQYFDGTFHGTFSEGDSVSLSFNGSAIYLYGAKRPNHGQYSVILDGGSPFNQAGYSSGNDLQQLLYSQTGLDNTKEHTIEVIAHPQGSSVPGVNNSQWWFDLDYAVITTAEDGPVYSTKIDDTSTLVTYGGGSWNGGPLNPQTYYNTTAHITNVVGAAMTMKFNGSSVGLYGGLYVDHGNYSVQLDGKDAGSYNATWFELETQVPLFVASGLADTEHTVVVSNVGQGVKGSFFDFDFAIVNSTVDPNAVLQPGNSTGTNTTTSDGSSPSGNSNDSNSSSTSKGKSSNAGAIAGGVVGGVVGLALVAFGVWWFFFRRPKAQKYPISPPQHLDIDGDELPTPYRDGDAPGDSVYAGYTTASTGESQSGATGPSHAHRSISSGPLSPNSGHSGAQMTQSNQPYLVSVPPPPPSNVTSYPRSVNPPSTVAPGDIGDQPNPFASGYSPALFTPSEYHDRAPSPGTPSIPSTGSQSQPSQTSQPPNPPPKSAGVTLPFTATRPRTDSSLTDSASDISPGRIQRPGREVDVGPMDMVPEQADEPTLPPDYQQATQPLPGQVDPTREAR